MKEGLSMLCKSCGTLIPDTANHCPNCGAAQENANINGFSAPMASQTNPAQFSPEEPKKKMNKKLKIVLIVVGAFIVIGVLGNLFGGDDSTPTSGTTADNQTTIADDTNIETKSNDKTPAAANPTTTAKPKTTAQPTTSATIGQKNALNTAHDYLDYSAFSYSGLVEQLEYEGYSHDEATWAADRCGADWNEQAAKCAQQYMDYSSFSRSGLIEQLEFEGFSHAQAVYGAESVGY